jgi:hypothetical protein
MTHGPFIPIQDAYLVEPESDCDCETEQEHRLQGQIAEEKANDAYYERMEKP